MRQGSRLPLWRARPADYELNRTERAVLDGLRDPHYGGRRVPEVCYRAGLSPRVVEDSLERLQALGFAWSYDYGSGRHWTLAWEDFGGQATEPYRPREWQPA